MIRSVGCCRCGAWTNIGGTPSSLNWYPPEDRLRATASLESVAWRIVARATTPLSSQFTVFHPESLHLLITVPHWYTTENLWSYIQTKTAIVKQTYRSEIETVRKGYWFVLPSFVVQAYISTNHLAFKNSFSAWFVTLAI